MGVAGTSPGVAQRGLAALAVAGIALAGTGAASAATPTYLIDCGGAAVRHPARIVLACADANAGLSGLRWTGWGGRRAHATGAGYRNDCTPTCVAGTMRTYRVRVTAGRREARTGSAVYRLLVVRAEGTPPAGVEPVETYRITAHGPALAP